LPEKPIENLFYLNYTIPKIQLYNISIKETNMVTLPTLKGLGHDMNIFFKVRKINFHAAFFRKNVNTKILLACDFMYAAISSLKGVSEIIFRI
jgi:hypothetical protein